MLTSYPKMILIFGINKMTKKRINWISPIDHLFFCFSISCLFHWQQTNDKLHPSPRHGSSKMSSPLFYIYSRKNINTHKKKLSPPYPCFHIIKQDCRVQETESKCPCLATETRASFIDPKVWKLQQTLNIYLAFNVRSINVWSKMYQQMETTTKSI
jgi:hypothetical protein